MNQSDLEKSWQITTNFLKAAGCTLRPDVDFTQYGEYLTHNKRELALDELITIGEAHKCSAKYWNALAAAAKNM